MYPRNQWKRHAIRSTGPISLNLCRSFEHDETILRD